MRIPIRLRWGAALTAIAAAMLISARVTPAGAPADTLPSQISEVEFWRLVTDLSEPNGPSPYENYVGNEVMLQRVIPAARKETKLGGTEAGPGCEDRPDGSLKGRLSPLS